MLQFFLFAKEVCNTLQYNVFQVSFVFSNAVDSFFMIELYLMNVTIHSKICFMVKSEHGT